MSLKKTYSIILVILFLSAHGFANSFYKVRLASVYDGDTFKVYLACRYPLFCKQISVRVNGIDCPELRSHDPCEEEAAKRAKRFTRDFLKSGPIVLRNCQKDKYFRLLCDVSVRGQEEGEPSRKNEKSLSETLLRKKLAVPYSGGTKQPIN